MSEDNPAKNIESFLRQSKLQYLFHFTDIRNLPTIFKYGLLTKQTLEQKNVLDKIQTGGNSLSRVLDLRHDNWGKVSLSWCPKIPMAYYREQDQHLCYLVFDSLLAVQEGVYFTDRNAVDASHVRFTGIEGINLVDIKSIKSSHPYGNEETKKKKQAEVLIPSDIDKEKILKVVVRSKSSLKEASRRCNEFEDLRNKIEVDSSLFLLPSPYIDEHCFSQSNPYASIETLDFMNSGLDASNKTFQSPTYLALSIKKVSRDTKIKIKCNDKEFTETINSTGKLVYCRKMTFREIGSHTIRVYLLSKGEFVFQFQEVIEVVNNEI
jgi:hypothetical protein